MEVMEGLVVEEELWMVTIVQNVKPRDIGTTNIQYIVPLHHFSQNYVKSTWVLKPVCLLGAKKIRVMQWPLTVRAFRESETFVGPSFCAIKHCHLLHYVCVSIELWQAVFWSGPVNPQISASITIFAMALAVSCQQRGPGSIPVQSIWNLLWTERHCDRLLSKYFSFLLSV